jgi:glycosyltransferase involved in cell wall biosynthesis
MRILTVNYEYPPLGGGGGVTCAQIAAELVAMGHEVDVLTSAGLGLPLRDEEHGVSIRRVPVMGRKERQRASLLSMVSFVLRAPRIGREMVREKNYDVIHVHFAVPTGPAGIKIGRIAKRPVVLSIHGGDLYDPTKWMSPHRFWPAKRVVKQVLKQARLVVAQSTNTAENARAYHGFQGRIEIIPLGLIDCEVPPATRQSFGLRDDDLVLLTIGRLVARKGVHFLIDALAAIPDPRVRLVVCGDGWQRPALEQQVAELGLGERVLFVGHVSDERKFQLLELADVFVMASVHEGFGIVFLEAMSRGLPIIATNVGGQTDFLQPSRNAILVPHRDRGALTDAIVQFHDDADLRRRMGAASLEDVEAFRMRRVCEQWVELFEEVCRDGT